jgi:cytoskeletal protein RodZ
MVAALRDTWEVAWSGGRPVAARAQAMAFVLLLVVAVGSVGAVTTVGAFNVLFPTTSSPTVPLPSVPAVVIPSPRAADTPEPTETAEPTETDEPTETAEPTETLKPRETVEPDHTNVENAEIHRLLIDASTSLQMR